MTSLGQELKKERESRGISIKALAESTRITGRYLEAIETDRLDLLPGGFFVKGMVRAYAKALGLDENKIIEKYKEAGSIESTPFEGPSNTEISAPLSRRRKLSLAGLAAAVLIIMTFTVYFLTKRETPRRIPETADLSSPNLSSEALAAPALKPEPQPPPPEEERGLRLEISFREITWIQVYADGRPALDGVKIAGEKVQVRAEQELLIHIGNAGGFDYSLNGRPGKAFGKSGAVVKNIRITPENAEEFFQGKEAATE